jgi:hypothetical protein
LAPLHRRWEFDGALAPERFEETDGTVALSDRRDDAVADAYRAPEQLRGDPSVGPAADVFALGAIVAERLAKGGEPCEAGLLDVLERMRAVDVASRLADADDVLRALEEEGLEDADVRSRAVLHRVAVVRIPLPPLRKRPEDVEPIATKLLRGFGADPARTPALFAPAFMGRLRAAAWPGNVRELRNHLERCLVFQDAALPLALDLPAEGAPSPDPTRTFADARRAAIAAFERDYVARLVELHGGNVGRAAEAAEVDRAYLYRLLRRARQQPPGAPTPPLTTPRRRSGE